MKELVYETQGTCSKAIRIVVNDNDIIQDVQFLGGCDGNTHGIMNLVKGMPAQMVIDRLKGVTCGFKATSCPDQLAKALSEMISKE